MCYFYFAEIGGIYELQFPAVISVQDLEIYCFD